MVKWRKSIDAADERRSLEPIVIGLLLLAVCSCSRRGPAPVRPPAIDASQAGADAVAAYDTDGNGILSKAELQQCPGLLKAIASYDSDASGDVTADEIARRIEQWQRTGKGLTPVSCLVLLDGQPLAGADVVLEPAAYLAGSLKSAFGTTRKDGRTALSLSDDDIPADLKRFHYKGMQVGVYTVQVTHPQRPLAARYNSESVLGEEISPRTTNVVVRLKSSSPGVEMTGDG